MSLSIDKCKAIIFTRKRIIPDANVMYNDQRITLESKGKLWVLYLTQDSMARLMFIFRALSGVWWGSHHYSQKLLYNAIIRSHMDYGLFVLDPINKLATEKLNKIQYRSLRLAAWKQAPLSSLTR
ncbi:jg11634 [Pararge aegeria aegeria]|uniref:Jg11634 protein n=1 Tax=Pararge aegeria aegeria TaxID=348720 RepID=A0A8S4RR96_9NEOP|nr:jg11634 [Pararge aegeria aegeria]